jgi:hypothetical protein
MATLGEACVLFRSVLFCSLPFCCIQAWFRIVAADGQFRWPRGSTAARLLGLRVRIPPGAWISVPCECCVLSGRGLCGGPNTRPEESYCSRALVSICQ